MVAALSGFAVIWSVVAVGWFVAHRRVIGSQGQAFLNKVAFLVASPALMFNLVSTGSLDHVFSLTLAVSVCAILVTAGAYLLVNRLVFKHDVAGATIGWMASAYTNAGNLGLPIAQHVLGDMTWMAPIMLVQLGLLQPFALACLDAANARRDGREVKPWRYLTLPLRNPISLGILAGLAANLAHLRTPDWLHSAIAMIGGMAVPMMLIAFGVSLRLDALPGTGAQAREVWTIQALKIVVMPLVALAVGSAAGLDRHQLLAVAVLAALPCAQNIYVIAQRYGRSEQTARDCVFWSTLLTVPAMLVICAFLA